MDERILTWLYDVKLAIEEIEGFLSNTPNDFKYYSSNLLLKRAIERNLEIIGEAVNRIVKHDDKITIEHSGKIVGLRNQIIHAYDNISDESIWAIIQKHLPLLKLEVNSLIESFG